MKETRKEIVKLNANERKSYKFRFENFLASSIECNDGINTPYKIFYSVISDGKEFTDDFINTLFFKEKVSEVSITIINETSEIIDSFIELSYDKKEKNETLFPKFESDLQNVNYNIDDVFKIGDEIHQNEDRTNYFLNKLSPVKIKYFKIELDEDSADFILNEVSLKKVKEEKCISIMTESNKIPEDEEATYTEWGFQYANFNGSFSKMYFEENFGIGSKPIVGDYLIFLARNIWFSISSVVAVYGGNSKLVGWNVSMTHYNHDTSIRNRSEQDLESYAKMSEKSFFDKILNDGQDSADFKQNSSRLSHSDENRELITKEVSIISDEKFNYYDIKRIQPATEPAVVYKNRIESGRTYSLSFNVMIPEKEFGYSDEIFLFNGNYRVGFSNNVPYIDLNGSIKSFGYELDRNVWYSLLINFNSDDNSLNLISHKISNRERKNTKYSDDSFEIKPISSKLQVNSIESRIGQIRFWKSILPVEYEIRVLFSKFVEKQSSAFIIDNCDTILNIRTGNRPDDFAKWNDIEENRKQI